MVQCIRSATSVQRILMLIKRANYLAENRIFLYILQERLQETFHPGFVLWTNGFIISKFWIDWQTEVRLMQF